MKMNDERQFQTAKQLFHSFTGNPGIDLIDNLNRWNAEELFKEIIFGSVLFSFFFFITFYVALSEILGQMSPIRE